MATDSETPELPQQVQALLCFLIHIDYVIIKTEFWVNNCTQVLKTRHYFHGLLIYCYWNRWFRPFLFYCQTLVLSFLKYLDQKNFPSTMSLEHLTEESILRGCFCPGDVQPKLCRQRTSRECGTALVDTTSLVYTENSIGERTHPCGAPVFTISSSYLAPLNVTICGRSHRNCLMQRTRVQLAHRSKNLLIRRWGWIVLKADEKSMNITHTDDPDLPRWLAIRFTRTRHASSTPLLAL